MKVDIFTIADYAVVDANSKLTIVGAFDCISSTLLPAIWDLSALALKLRFEQIECGSKTLKISFTDADGKMVMQGIESKFEVPICQGEQATSIPAVYLLPLLIFPTFGEYSINLAVDGRHEASIPFYVRRMAQPAPLPQQAV